MAVASIQLAGKTYVMLEREEYDRLATLAKAAALPPLPEADADGHVPAVAYARASLARKIIRQRAAMGLNQRQLAKLAGLPVETVCRVENGRHTPSTATIVKIDRAFKRAGKQGA